MVASPADQEKSWIGGLNGMKLRFLSVLSPYLPPPPLVFSSVLFVTTLKESLQSLGTFSGALSVRRTHVLFPLQHCRERTLVRRNRWRQF